MRFRILASSSAGNSALLRTDTCTVLIDAGLSGRRIEQLLRQAGASLQDIDAIFLTHEHGDHSLGLRGLTRKRPELKVFANADTARALQDRLDRPMNWQTFQTGLPFTFHNLEVTPFSVPHDAYDPVGYLIRSDSNTANSRSLCWLTDLGYIPPRIREYAQQCDLLIVEANYDPDLLEACENRTWSLKQRIRGRHGHLSNQTTYELLAEAEAPTWQHICLVHISAECNRLDIVRRVFDPLQNGARNLNIHVHDPASLAPGTEFHL